MDDKRQSIERRPSKIRGKVMTLSYQKIYYLNIMLKFFRTISFVLIWSITWMESPRVR